MKNSTLKRLGLRLLQHLLAACILAGMAGILMNSYFEVDSIDGTQVYRIFPLDSEQSFEESEIYHKLFQNAVSDITQLVVIKGQLETNDVLDPSKKIDMTQYASQIGVDEGCEISVVYELDDIIKWGKYGVEYTNRMMSMTDFINYFGNCIYPENFALNEYGEFFFDGFYRVDDGTETVNDTGEESEAITGPEEQEITEEAALISEKMAEYTDAQLEDLVFSYIMGKNLSDIHMSRNDDGSQTVSVPMLNCRYPTADGEKQLTAYADNWVDYILLQNNVASVIKTLTVNYQRYQVCNDAYKEGSSSVKYVVRMMTDNGICTYTNVSWLKDLPENEITEFFSEYRRYLIYYPDSLVFMGNTMLSEEELDSYISLYSYAYPDTTHIWLGVDTDYTIEGDAFYIANSVYEKFVANVGRFFTLLGFLALVWLGIGIYLTVMAGMPVVEDGRQVWNLNRFDRIWLELILLLGAGAAYVGMSGYQMIRSIAEATETVPVEIFGIQLTKLYRYGVFALYGIYVSAAFNLFWYSFIRRIKAGNLWKDSFFHCASRMLVNSVKYIFRHKSSVVSTLLPYNLFLFSNLVGIVAVYRLQEQQKVYAMLILAGMLALDVLVGTIMFRRSAEQIEIVEGINKIRDGEVDFKLETENLHGSSKELADAVNNIGEGIRKAVKTSMKDEQMKTDLITNVSHDIKTPLTSIINYVDLLKRLKIEEEPAKGYIAILDGKAQRLKQLTDDLVEASKISSGSIVLDCEKLNLTELINQSLGEFSEKLEECRLQVIFEKNDMPAYIFADSRRMWRVAENLFNNICKYAMEGTRVYIDIAKTGGRIEASVKNISRQQMNIRPEELTERFIRGDSARTTEGSGLGLSIAKSLIQVQGGSFEIFLDGDLFKIMLSFPEFTEEDD